MKISFNAAEKKVNQKYNLQNISHENDPRIKKMYAIAFKYKKNKEWLNTALIYAALAIQFTKNGNYALIVARKYRLADATNDSARWFLEAANRFAKQTQSVKAISALRMFELLKPDSNRSDVEDILGMCKQSIEHQVFDFTQQHTHRNEDSIEAMISDVELFSAFADADLQMLLTSLTFRRFHHKEVLTQEGEQANSLYILTSGGIKAQITRNNKSHDLGSIHNNNVFGIIAYFTGGERAAGFIAHGHTEVLELSYDMLDYFVDHIPGFGKSLDALYDDHLLFHHLTVSDVFGHEPVAIRQEVSKKMYPIYIMKGQILFRAGETSSDLYLVRKGELGISFAEESDGKFRKVVVSGGIAGEIAISARNKRTAYAYALTDCVLMKLDADDFSTIYKQSPSLQKTITKMLKKQAKEAIQTLQNERLIKGKLSNPDLAEAYWIHDQKTNI
ncbi:MAG: cyclic nucleotide-binding domain-containing protein [Ghiorsea sp.]